MKNMYMPYNDGHRLQFRVDLFNAFNHFNLDNAIGTTIADTRDGGAPITASGTITSTNETPRVIQLSLKYLF